VFEIKGLAARVYFAFTLSSPPAAAVAPVSPPPAARARIIRGRKRGLGAARGTCGTGRALRAPVNRADPGTGPATGFRRLPWVPGGLGPQGAGMGRIEPGPAAGRGLTVGG